MTDAQSTFGQTRTAPLDEFQWLECFPGAACVVDPTDRIVGSNSLARELLRTETSFEFGLDGPSGSINDTNLLASIREARAALGTPAIQGVPALVARGTDDAPAVPLFALSRPLLGRDGFVLVWLCSRDHYRVPPTPHLRTWFKLSTAESRVAQLLCSGSTLEGAAATRRRKRTTMRNQMGSVFQKVAAHRQAELVALLSGRLPVFPTRLETKTEGISYQ